MNVDKSLSASYNLLDAATALSEILDQPVDERGGVRVMWKRAAELIATVQIAAKNAVDRIDSLTDE